MFAENMSFIATPSNIRKVLSDKFMMTESVTMLNTTEYMHLAYTTTSDIPTLNLCLNEMELKYPNLAGLVSHYITVRRKDTVTPSFFHKLCKSPAFNHIDVTILLDIVARIGYDVPNMDEYVEPEKNLEYYQKKYFG